MSNYDGGIMFEFLVAFLIGFRIHPSFAASYSAQDTFTGNYSVPVPASLKNWASWDLRGVKWIQNKKKLRSVYYLPPEIVGEEPEPIVLEGEFDERNDHFDLKGEAGEARCLSAKSSRARKRPNVIPGNCRRTTNKRK